MDFHCANNKCKQKLKEPGGLFFTEPCGDVVGAFVSKYHLCRKCTEKEEIRILQGFE